MSKVATLITFLLLLSFNLIYASRPNAVSSLQLRGLKDIELKAEMDDENCEEGTEECLMRRTLAAHTDYIYTQKHKPKP
ncbi:hypothetical protein Fmac_031733 [Flemingia macrophylla]|uniref:Phytosulfokine n=1 Tax=Flemingia macrophylla TaxID=520843 RepID=A0ABD1L2W7_9FABA